MADNVEIQGLEFEIVNNSKDTVKGLEALIDTLKALKTATSGGTGGLSKTADSIRKLNDALRVLVSRMQQVRFHLWQVHSMCLRALERLLYHLLLPTR